VERNQLIEHHLDFCNLLARSIGRKHPTNRDGVKSEAYLGLCYAVDKILEMKVTDLHRQRAWIAQIVRRVVLEFIPRDKIIGCSRGVNNRNEIPKIVDINLHPTGYYYTQHDEALEIADILKLSKLTHKEKYVVLLCLMGHTDIEIAAKLIYTASGIRKLRLRAGRKVKETIGVN